jgi:hypothetical protein
MVFSFCKELGIHFHCTSCRSDSNCVFYRDLDSFWVSLVAMYVPIVSIKYLDGSKTLPYSYIIFNLEACIWLLLLNFGGFLFSGLYSHRLCIYAVPYWCAFFPIKQHLPLALMRSIVTCTYVWIEKERYKESTELYPKEQEIKHQLTFFLFIYFFSVPGKFSVK